MSGTSVCPLRISALQARRLALLAQGFGVSRPTSPVTARHLRRLFDRVGLLQLDSVNVVCRSHYLPCYSRYGPYDTALLDRMAANRVPGSLRHPRPNSHQRELIEYWAHEASLVPAADMPLFKFRMDSAHSEARWSFMRIPNEQAELVARVRAKIEASPPLPAGEYDASGRSAAGSWWNRTAGKEVLEWLFLCGEISARRVTGSFTREYGSLELLWPPSVRAAVLSTGDPRWAQRELLLKAAGHYGVATAVDLADYHRLHVPTARGLIGELVDDGLLRPATVEGWVEPAFVLPGTTLPRLRQANRALLSPFDSLVWFRPRVQRLWSFHYRLEFYVPAPKRIYGYYVMPFLLGEDLVARVEVKADRKAGMLRVGGAWAEDNADLQNVVQELGQELSLLAQFLGLGGWAATPRGDLGTLLHSSDPSTIGKGARAEDPEPPQGGYNVPRCLAGEHYGD